MLEEMPNYLVTYAEPSSTRETFVSFAEARAAASERAGVPTFVELSSAGYADIEDGHGKTLFLIQWDREEVE